MNKNTDSKLIIPEGVTRLEYDSLYLQNKNFASIVLPNSISYIDWRAFENFKELKSIVIPASVIGILSDPFRGCTKLSEIKVSSDNTEYKDVDGVLYSIDGKKLICFPADKEQADFHIPDGVEVIDECAFAGNKHIQSIVLPKGLKEICEDAFAHCTSLKSITIQEGIEKIISYAFYDCSSLVSIVLPNGLTLIGRYAFSDCTSLDTIEIPKTIRHIESHAFEGCRGLRKVHFLSDSLEEYRGDNLAFDEIGTTPALICPEGAEEIYCNDYRFGGYFKITKNGKTLEREGIKIPSESLQRVVDIIKKNISSHKWKGLFLSESWYNNGDWRYPEDYVFLYPMANFEHLIDKHSLLAGHNYVKSGFSKYGIPDLCVVLEDVCDRYNEWYNSSDEIWYKKCIRLYVKNEKADSHLNITAKTIGYNTENTQEDEELLNRISNELQEELDSHCPELKSIAIDDTPECEEKICNLLDFLQTFAMFIKDILCVENGCPDFFSFDYFEFEDFVEEMRNEEGFSYICGLYSWDFTYSDYQHLSFLYAYYGIKEDNDFLLYQIKNLMNYEHVIPNDNTLLLLKSKSNKLHNDKAKTIISDILDECAKEKDEIK